MKKINLNRHDCWLTVGGIGFFSLTAQSLFFRMMLSGFDGNELLLGLFLASWLFWLAGGAAAGRLLMRRRLPGGGVILFFLPAAMLQLLSIIFLRDWLGAPYFAVLPLWRAVAAVWLVNAPVALISGLLFPVAAGWVRHRWATSSGGVYLMDLAGCVAGALCVTFLLWCGWAEITVMLTAVFVLAVVAARVEHHQVVQPLSVVLAVITLSLMVNGKGYDWQQRLDRYCWNQRLPGSKYLGSFSTAQSRYWYGRYQSNWVVGGWSGTIDSLPDRESGLMASAAALVQQPHPRRVLLVGEGGAALLTQLVQLPEVHEVVWLAPDPEYPRALLRHLPENLLPDRRKLKVPAVDLRTYLTRSQEPFDLVLLRLGAPASIAMNRYFSYGCFVALKGAMRSDAVLGVSFPGGENYLGRELALTGAVLLTTLERIFPAVVLQPGTASCFWSGASGSVSRDPEVWRQRLAVSSLKNKCDAAVVDSLYEPSRADFQLAAYRSSQEREKALLNTDRCPAMFFYTALFYFKKSGESRMTDFMMRNYPGFRTGLNWGWPVLGLAGLVLVLWRARRDNRFCSAALALAAAVTMALEVLVLLRFQFDYGTIFLYFGLANALLLAGMTVGSWLAVKWLSASRVGVMRWNGLGVLFIIAGSMLFSAGVWPLAAYAVLLTVLGLTGGFWLPYFAWQIKQEGADNPQVAARLATVDNLGGMIGAMVTPLILLPLIFESGTLCWILTGCIVLAVMVCCRHCGVRKVVMMMLLAGGSSLLLPTANAQSTADWRPTAQQLGQFKINNNGLTAMQAQTDGKTMTYYRLGAAGAADGYLFRTSDLVTGPKGYNAPIAMLAYVDAEGKLRGFTVIASRETPKFMVKVMTHQGELKAQNLFNGEAAFKGDAVTGATYSSRAMTATLNAAGKKFKALLANPGTTIKVPAAEKNSAVLEEENPPGGPRKIDAASYRQMIRNHQISDHSAQFATVVNNP